MRRFLFLITLILFSSVAFCQWDDDDYYSSKKKQKNVSATDNTNYYSTQYTNSNSLPELSKDAKEALITNFDAALQRRLFAMKSTAEHEESYWEIIESYYHFLRNSYDKNLYNVIALNDQVWVEPQYITAMFNGSDPAQGVNDYIEVLMKEKKYEAKKKNEKKYSYGHPYCNLYWSGYGGWSFGFGWHWGGWYNPWYPWGPYDPWWHPWGPWGPYHPWGPWRPYGPWGPWGPYHPGVIVVVPSHPVYYGNSPYRSGGVFSPSPSLRSPGVTRSGVSPSTGNPMGRGYASPTGGSVSSKSSGNQRTIDGSRNYRNNTPTPSNSYRSMPGGGGGGSFSPGGGGGGGFHSIGGGGFRR